MANTAAYCGLRWGELVALTIPPDRHGGPGHRRRQEGRRSRRTPVHEAPKNRKRRRTIYPRRTPSAYPLAERLGARIEEARAEQRGRGQPARADLPLA